MEAWVPVLVALVAGLTSAPVWNYFARRIGWGQTEMDRLRRQHETCEQQLRDLSKRLAIVEQHHGSAFARWILDTHKRVSWLNSKALVSIFGPMGLTRAEVEGKNFHELIDRAAADELDRLTHGALAHDGTAISNLIRLHPDLPVMHIVVIATDGRDGELIYEAVAFRMNDPDVVIGLGIGRLREQRARSIDSLTKPSGDSQSG
jgi:hypothetical protein